MKRMSLTTILEEIWEDVKEPEADPNFPELPGDPEWMPETPEELFKFHRITEQDFQGWVNRINKEGFTPQIYKEMARKVGDIDNFMLVVQGLMPQIYKGFQEKGFGTTTWDFPANPDAAKSLGKPGQVPADLQAKFDQAGDEPSWEELADRGREIQYPDPQKRAFEKWKEESSRAQDMGKTPPPPPVGTPPGQMSLQQAVSPQIKTRPNIVNRKPQPKYDIDAPTNPAKKIR